jgi:dolichol-phosphate mannosyltransferase
VKRACPLIIVSTYNEIENLPGLVDAILHELPDCHVLVIDDNSPDGTGRWCDQRAATELRLRCLHRPGKQGLGTATVAGLRYGLDHGYPLLITMDADWSHDPRYLPQLVDGMQTPSGGAVDVLIGSRYVPGGGVRGWPLRRRLMSRAINAFSRWWLGLDVHDTSGALRCYRSDCLRRLDLSRVRSEGYSVFEELLWRLTRAGARCAELPIVFTDRDRGVSKISLREALRSLLQLVRLRWQGL